MKSRISFFLIVGILILQSCGTSKKAAPASRRNDAAIKSTVKIRSGVPARTIDTKNVSADELVVFAESLQGVPYKYGSMDPKKGLDCSGFINYVFGRFKISVPRTSSDFTNAGKEVAMRDAKPGDLILFTGSDPKSGVVGHMGIITTNEDKQIRFIHSASGGGRGVMVSGMSDYFVTRFVKVIRVFKDS